MRIKLTLRPLQEECMIPINYQYPISAAIYKILSSASPDYAAWLHNQGYISPNGKLMKLFVFSKLNIYKREVRGNILKIKDFSPCILYLASPMLEDFIHSFIQGLFNSQIISLGNRYTKGSFKVENVETVLSPTREQWQELAASDNINFKCLSPIVASIQEKENSASYYLRPNDKRLSEAIRINLIQKFFILHKQQPSQDHLQFSLDQDYIRRKGGHAKISKLIWIKEGQAGKETKIKSFIAPFNLKGSPELIQCAYDCGIGEKNSLGFGMIELV